MFLTVLLIHDFHKWRQVVRTSLRYIFHIYMQVIDITFLSHIHAGNWLKCTKGISMLFQICTLQTDGVQWCLLPVEEEQEDQDNEIPRAGHNEMLREEPNR